MKSPLKSAAAAVSLCFATVAFAADKEGNEQHLRTDQLPAAVKATLQKEGGQVQEVERETDGGRTFYEATLSKDGKNYSLHIGDDGKVLKRESASEEAKEHKK